ncbi:amino acid permease [soil metagenome]
MTGRPGDGAALERDLGFPAVVTISLGAMIGSGIFVLPGLAVGAAGPAAPLAYLLAGLIVLPAALSKAELSTAMPQSGGTYLFIDRALGPLVGTVAGFGVWFSLVFKAAFALVGLGAYLQILVAAPARPVAIVAAGALILLNIAGTKQSGRLQTVVVTGVLAVLVVLVIYGLPSVDPAAFQPLLPTGADGLLAASGLVFVSYAGVTKVASIAEEIKDPGRTIPRGILSSIALMMVLYTVIVTVVVGVVPVDELRTTLTPIALVAQRVAGPVGEWVIALTAVLALLSMANAGLLTSSRYPFAMSRDSLLPSGLERVHPRFGTPAAAIGLTGTVLVALVAFVPVIDLAKLASAFQILVFTLVNVALIIFRSSHMRWYRPEFRSPVYPWMQIAGIVGGLVLLTQMGSVSVVGAVLIVVAGVTLYLAYGRARTVREGVAVDVARRTSDGRFVALTERALLARTHRVVVPMRADLASGVEAALVWLAIESATSRHGEVHLLRVEPSARMAAPQISRGTRSRRGAGGHQRGVMILEHSIGGDDPALEVAAFVADHDVDLVVAALDVHSDGGARVFADDVQWLMDNIGCDIAFVRAGAALPHVDRIVVMGAGGPFDELKVVLANRVAVSAAATIRFVHVVDPSTSDRSIEAIRFYHARLANLTAVPTASVVERAPDQVERLCALADAADLAIVGATESRQHPDVDFTALADRLAVRTTTPLLVVHASVSHRHSYLGRFLERRLYGSPVGDRGLR